MCFSGDDILLLGALDTTGAEKLKKGTGICITIYKKSLTQRENNDYTIETLPNTMSSINHMKSIFTNLALPPL